MTNPESPHQRRQPFPRSLAEKIARRAHLMAQTLEDRAVRDLTRQAIKALAQGDTEAEVARQLSL